MKNLLIIFILFLTIVPASAQEAELIETIGDIELEINENGIVAVMQNIELLAQERVYQADITIPKAKAESVEISDLGRILEYDSIITDNEEIINYYFLNPLIAGEKRSITIKYSTEFFTNKQGDTWELSFFLPTSNKSAVKIIFPENVIISFTSSEVVPSTYIENGRQILELKSEGDKIDFLCEYKFKETETETETQTNQTVNETKKQEPEIPEFTKEREGDNYVLILFTIIIILVALMYYFKLRKKSGKEKEEIKEPKKSKKVKPAIFRVLNKDEKKVVELLQSGDDEVTQAYIHKSTQIPRSTLSKIMFRLEERNIIERRSEGKTKWIKLKKWVFE